MTPREKVSLQEFSVDTTLSPEAIREAGRRAAEAGTQFLGFKIRERAVADSGIGYVIDGFGISGQQMELAVGWEELEYGRRRVSLEVGDFATERWQLWGFIPLSPKSPTAMGPLKRFSARLRKELT